MRKTQNLHAPWLGGWVMGVAMGAIAFAVARTVGPFDLVPSAAMGVVIALVAGMVMGMPWGATGSVAPRAAVRTMPVPVAAAAPLAVAAPTVAVAPAPVAAVGPARRPEALTAPRGGKADDLKIIKGIGPKLETLCHALGFYHFDQLAAWKADEVSWVDDNLEGFKGRVTRDRWVPQAQAIVKLGPEAFLKRLDAGEDF